MAARLIQSLRRGQAELKDRKVLDISGGQRSHDHHQPLGCFKQLQSR